MPSRRIITILAVLAIACFVVASCIVIRKPSARNEARVAESVGKQLDRVAEQTPVIRQEQEEKQREASQIEGADTPLPDNFGRNLERVRRGGKHSDSR